MSKLQSIIDEINDVQNTKYLIWHETCQYTGRLKVSIRCICNANGGHTTIKTAYHANALIKTAKEILQDKLCSVI